MKIKLENVDIVISENPNNWEHPAGRYQNIPFVKRDETWYHCGLSFFEKDGHSWIRISNLNLQKENNTITHMEQGVYKELPISKFNKFRCQYAMNNHSLNRLQHNFKTFLKRRKNSIGVFAVSIGLALVYYFGNETSNGAWADYIAKNNYIQTLFILLNLFSIGSVFYPFTIQKPLSEKSIRELCQEEAKKYDEEKERNREIEQRATF